MKNRFSKQFRLSSALLLASGALLVSGKAAVAQQYTLTFLGQLTNTAGSRRSQAYEINDSGMIVGYSNVPYRTSGSTTGAFYYQNGVMTGAGPFPGGDTSTLTGVNDNGIAVGTADSKAVIYDTNTKTYTRIGPADSNSSSANAINNVGLIVGSYRNGVFKPVLFTSGGVQYLPTLDGNTTGTGSAAGSALGINNSGQIIGNSGTATTPGIRNAYFLNPDGNGGYTTTDLVAIARSQGLNLFNFDSVGTGISANYATGTFVYADTYSNGVRFSQGFVYNIASNSITSLGLYNGNSTYAFDINDAGTAVGYANFNSNGTNNERIAFATLNGIVTDLNSVTNLATTFNQNGTTLSFTKLNEANGVNNQGQITGWGVLSNGTIGAFLLTPTLTAVAPEPGTLALLPLPALLGLMVARRKRQSQRA